MFSPAGTIFSAQLRNLFLTGLPGDPWFPILYLYLYVLIYSFRHYYWYVWAFSSEVFGLRGNVALASLQIQQLSILISTFVVTPASQVPRDQWIQRFARLALNVALAGVLR
jgi:hypothetical protein